MLVRAGGLVGVECVGRSGTNLCWVHGVGVFGKSEKITNSYIFPRKTNTSGLPGSTYFETCLKYWQEPYLCACGSEFKTTDGEAPKNIPVNAYEIEKVTLVETEETK